jgi:hypothetical protein
MKNNQFGAEEQKINSDAEGVKLLNHFESDL